MGLLLGLGLAESSEMLEALHLAWVSDVVHWGLAAGVERWRFQERLHSMQHKLQLYVGVMLAGSNSQSLIYFEDKPASIPSCH